MKKKLLLMLSLLFCILTVAAVAVTTRTATYGPYDANIYPDQYYVKTLPVYFEAGDMHIYVKNVGPGTLNYYVFYACDNLECPIFASGTVVAGSYKAYLKTHSKGKFILKLESPYSNTQGYGNISQ